MSINKSDYEEPKCVLCMPKESNPIPLYRVLEKFDKYMTEKNFDQAERHLKYWLTEATNGNDFKGKVSVLNELIGLYRKINRKEDGYGTCDIAIKFAAEYFPGTETEATVFLNCGTCYEVFEDHEKALLFYEKAHEIYKKELPVNDPKFAGLYNNMAIPEVIIGEYEKALSHFEKAINILKTVGNSELDMAITYCNMADLYAKKDGSIESEGIITDLLEQAMNCFNKESLQRDGYYAYVCEKCAPVFGIYGFFMDEEDLMERARRFYEGN